MAEKLGTSMSSKEINGDDATASQNIVKHSQSLPALDAKTNSPLTSARKKSARRSKSKGSLKDRQMEKRRNFMKQRKLGKTPRPEWKDVPPLSTEKPYHFLNNEKFCRVGYTVPRKKYSMGLAPLPQPPIKYKVNKPSMPKPKSIFKTKESKKPAYPGEASEKEDEGEEKGGFFLTQTEDEGEKEDEQLLDTSDLHMASKIVESSDSESSGWDTGSDVDLDLEEPIGETDKLMSEKEKYFGKEGRNYLSTLYKNTSYKTTIRRNPMNQEEIYDRPATATRRYVDNCHTLNLSPEPLFIRKHEGENRLNLSHKGIGETMMSALNDPLHILPNIDELDLTDCRMEDDSLTRTIKMVQSREKNKGLKSLNLSENHLGPHAIKAMCALISPLRQVKSMKPTLTDLKLERCRIDDNATKLLCKVLHDNVTITKLSLAHNKIESVGASALAEMVQFNRHIMDLDLSWNGIRGDGATDLAIGLAKSQVKKLNLKLNAFGRCKAAGELGKWIQYSNIEYLDLTGNHISELPVCMLMNGIQLHEKLETVILNENPIGKLGVSSVLRAVDTCVSMGWHKNIELHRCSCEIETAMDGEAGMGMAAFDFLEPAGVYELDTGIPEQYALACEILRIMNTRNGFDLRSVSKVKPNGDATKIRIQRKDKGFLQDKKGGTRDILTDGKPSKYVVKATGKEFVIPDEPTILRFDVMVREHLPKPFNVISREGFEEIYKMVSYPHTVPNRLAIANAACETFYFSASQVERLCGTFHKDIVEDILPSFLMRVCSEDQEGADLLAKNKSLLKGKSGKIFCKELPTDNYLLDLADSMDRHLCMTLLRINNDDRSKGLKRKNFIDTSQHGDQSCFRNVMLDGEPFNLIGMLDKNHHVPRQGFLSFDFVTTTIPPLGTKETGIPDEDDIESEVTFRAWLRTNYISCQSLIDNVIRKLPKPKDWLTLDDKITALFHLLDEDDGGEVDKLEVLEAILKRPEVGDFMCQIPELEPLLEPRTFGPAFDAIDQDGGGSLDLDEFRQMCGIAEDIAQVAQEMFEADSDDEWDEEEEAELRNRLNKLVENKLNLAHKAARERMKNGTLDERLDAVMALFEECDEGDKEYLMPPEFAQLTANLGIILSAEELEDAIERIDEDGNGQIEVDEYLDWWGDDDLTERYEERAEALESGKPYRLLGSEYKGEAEERLASVRGLFDQCDVGDKEYLMPDEFALLSAKLGVRLSERELETAIEEIDEDGNGQIEIDEYLDWWGDTELIRLYNVQLDALEAGKPYMMMGEELLGESAEKRLAVVIVLFKVCDQGDKDYLDPNEFAKLSKILGVILTPFELMKAIEEIDEDGNGQIEIDEYLDWWGDKDLIAIIEEFGEDWEPGTEEKDFANEWFEDKKNEPFKKAEEERLKREAIAAKKAAKEEAERLKREAELKMDRAAYIVAAHPRIMDLEKFIKIWKELSDSESHAIEHRLGWLNVFDPVSPDKRWYMNLLVKEQWRVATIMVKLAIVEPGENWVYEHYWIIDKEGNMKPKPGWQLPVSWATKVPQDPKGPKLVLTYSSTGAGCAPVWSERLKMRKLYSLVHDDAPLPIDSEEMGEQEQIVSLDYTAFIRLVSGEFPIVHLVNAAKQEIADIAEAARKALLDSDEEDEEEIARLEAMDDGFFETGKVQEARPEEEEVEYDSDGNVIEKPPDPYADLMMDYPDDYNEVNAIKFLEICKVHFDGSMNADGKGEDDMEDILEEEWDIFKENVKEAVEKDPELPKGFELLHKVFSQLNW